MSVLDRKPLVADYRVAYGAGEFQFGDLWVPVGGGGPGGFPVVVLLHGGWWRSVFGLGYCGFLCAALRGAGVAVWSMEYRRVGDAGGGWTGTFEDVAAGFDFLPGLAGRYGLDMGRVVAAGHSAGGQLAFWLAGRHHIFEGSPIRGGRPGVRLRGVVGLAAAVDLRLTRDLSSGVFAGDKRQVERLMGGSPEEVPERYRAGNPGDLLPLNVPQILIQGSVDGQIPPALPRRWAELAGRHGDSVRVVMVPGADHFDVVDPESAAWPVVRAGLLGLL